MCGIVSVYTKKAWRAPAASICRSGVCSQCVCVCVCVYVSACVRVLMCVSVCVRASGARTRLRLTKVPIRLRELIKERDRETQVLVNILVTVMPQRERGWGWRGALAFMRGGVALSVPLHDPCPVTTEYSDSSVLPVPIRHALNGAGNTHTHTQKIYID